MKRASRRLETKLRREGYSSIAGADEVGKGAWAGPLVAAAVILGPEIRLPNLRDSKLLSSLQRERLFVRITRTSLAWAVGVVPPARIDLDGIQAANRQAIADAAGRLAVRPDLLLVDAIRVDVDGIESRAVEDGDGRVSAIAAASIVAKVIRDELMRGFHRHYPQYGFDEHKGYGTDGHLERLRWHGACPIHRLSFEPIRQVVRGSP